MRKLLTILIIIPFVCQLTLASDSNDSLNTCNAGFTYQLIDSLLYRPVGHGLMLISESSDSSLTHKWILSNGLESEEPNPVFMIAHADSVLEVCHKIVDVSGILCEHCEEVFIPPVIGPFCHANFTFYEDSTVDYDYKGVYQFIDQSSGTVTEWKWSFGDGDSAFIQNPIHLYAEPGFYHIMLEIETEDGCVTNMIKHLFIRSSDECDLKIDYDVLESFPPQYQFYTILYDPRMIYSFVPPPDDSTWHGLIQYFWDFGDGKTSTDEIPRHVFKLSGEYTVKLEVIYADGFKCSTELKDYFTGADQPDECNLTGTVRDYTGLDGCRYLIELDNGTRLEPILKDTGFYFYDNQRVRLSYIERPDMMSICMAGIIAEITCIEEIDPGTPPPWPHCESIILNTSFTLNGGYCSGTASVDIVTPCSAWWWYEMIKYTDYKILWSTGETTRTISGLCPGNLYFVNVTNPTTGRTFTAAFSIFQLNNVFPSWTFTRDENTYRFNLPVDDSYCVTWEFDDGISLVGEDVSYTFVSGGDHQVELVVKNESGDEIYSETIQLSIPTAIPEQVSESMTVFPNPANDVLNISLTGHSDEAISIGIYSFSGQLLITQHLSHTTTGDVTSLDISDLKPGIYLLVMMNGNGSSQSIKFEKH